MDLPVEIVYEILYFLDVYDVCAFSCTSGNNNVFYCEDLWKRKCDGIRKENESYMDACLGNKIPIMLHGDLLKYIRLKGDTIFPTSNFFIVLVTKNGAPLQYIMPGRRFCKYIPDEYCRWQTSVKGVMLDGSYILTHGNQQVKIGPPNDKPTVLYLKSLRGIVDEQTYSAKSKIPIYG